MFLRCYVHHTPTKWKLWLSLAEFWYNTSFHSSLGCTPFKVLYGYDPVVIAAPLPPDTKNRHVKICWQNTNFIWKLSGSTSSLLRKELRYKQTNTALIESFRWMRKVLLKLQPYAQSSVANRPFPKLSYKFYVPFTVLERVGKAAYMLDLPVASLIHPVFHIS
jgi:hypothetical protein